LRDIPSESSPSLEEIRNLALNSLSVNASSSQTSLNHSRTAAMPRAAFCTPESMKVQLLCGDFQKRESAICVETATVQIHEWEKIWKAL
jgi:hypothetical protein